MKNPSLGWDPSWSGRGITVLDNMGTTKSSKIYVLKTPVLTPLSKLKKLVLLFPDNKFYESLMRSSRMYAFSKKQMQSIEENYLKHFGS